MEGKLLVYIDESTFHGWQKPTKIWLKRGLSFPIQDTRGKSITVLGAIDKEAGLRHYMVVAESNRTAIFVRFLYELCKKLKGSDAVLVLDNLSIHKTNDVKILLQKFKDLCKFYLPPYSSDLNPIERFWRITKEQWRKRLMEQY